MANSRHPFHQESKSSKPSLSHSIGIDLGTTNCCLAFAPTPDSPVELFAIPQLVNAAEVRGETLFPSSLYIPAPNDFPAGTTALPWDDKPVFVTGRLAQSRGVETAGRLVTSAKSWLCHGGVDRTSALLPLDAVEGLAKVSPVTASTAYLAHIRQAWEHANPGVAFKDQQVLVTVPASFDAVARELTIEAAAAAGCANVILLEEPQAAFYAWLERHPDWRERVKPGDLILIADIGGGTTDFTLIAVREEKGDLVLERLAVGDHILLGGDNIDLALARLLEAEFAEKKTKLDPLQFHTLWQRTRMAKEKLLEDGNSAADAAFTIPGRGTGLIGGTLRAKLKRADLERVLLDGFFPETASTDMPQQPRRMALQQVGLPYAPDAAITRQLARFLRSDGELAAPTHVLFNGGVLRSAMVRERLMGVLNSWLTDAGKPAAGELGGADLMHAVARGAAFYGIARQGKAIRIRGGVPRSYYVGIESAMPAVPGMRAPVKAITVVPFGMEEGTEVTMPASEFALWVGHPAEFRFFCSSVRKDDRAGDVIDDLGTDVEELAPIEVNLPAESGGGQTVRVTLEAAVTETGVLQLWCVARDGRRWKLEFNVRERV